MITGVVGSSQYVVPFSSIKEVTFGQSTSVVSLPPVSDGYNFVVYDQAQSDIMSATPYPNSTYSDVYTTQVSSTTLSNSNSRYENGLFLITSSENSHIYTFQTVGGTITTSTVANARCVRWFAPMNAWVAAGNNGVFYTSTNGSSWTSRTVPAVFTINAMATNGTTLAVAGVSGDLYTTTSTNPASISWTSRTSSFGSTTIRDLEYHGGYWVAVADSGKVAYSTNATTWTQKATGTGTEKNCFGVTYHMGRWLVIVNGPSSSGETVRSDTTDPSGSWTIASSNEPACTKISSDGRYAFWVVTGGKLRYTR